MNKVLLITGGNAGIGFYMVKQWLEDGGRAAALDLSTDNLEPLRARHEDALLPIVCDVSDAEGVRSAVLQVIEAFGCVDFAVHNACVCPFKTLEETGQEEYRRVMEVNFLGAINLAKAVLPEMLRRRSGRICFTSSGVGVTGFTGISAYAASKGAVEAFARCMRLEYRDAGVTFHILHPPLTDTKSSEPLPVPKEFKASAEKVGRGLARRLDSGKFVIAASVGDAASIRISYLFPLQMGALLAKMTAGKARKK